MVVAVGQSPIAVDVLLSGIERANRAESGSALLDSWEFLNFGLHGQWSCAADDPFCIPSSNRGDEFALNVWPSEPGAWDAGALMPSEFRGAQIGHLVSTFDLFRTARDNSLSTVQSLDMQLTAGTLLVPINVVVVLPAAAIGGGTPRQVVEPYANSLMQRALFDDGWIVNGFRSSDQGQLLAQGGRWIYAMEDLPSTATRPELINRLATGTSGTFVATTPFAPDHIWAQCGIQFRLASVVFIEESDARRIFTTDDGQITGAPFCFGDRGGGFNATLLKGWLDDWVFRARDAAPDFGIWSPFAVNVMWVYTLFHDACAEQLKGVNPDNTHNVAVSILGQESFVLSHEIGHALGLEHPGDCSVNALMCAGPSQRSPTIAGCDVRDGVPIDTTIDSLPFNCFPRGAQVLPTTTCDAAREGARQLLSLQMRDLNIEPPAVDAGTDQTVECSSSAGAEVTLDGSVSPGSGSPFPIASTSWKDENGELISKELSVTLEVPMGTSEFTLRAEDIAGQASTDSVSVTVEDTTPPVLSDLAGVLATACGGSEVFSVGTPSAADACSETVSVTGAVVESDGAPLDPPLEVVDGQVALGRGTHVIEWTAVDDSGNSTTIQQMVEIMGCRNRSAVGLSA